MSMNGVLCDIITMRNCYDNSSLCCGSGRTYTLASEVVGAEIDGKSTQMSQVRKLYQLGET